MSNVMKIKGLNTTAKIFTDLVENTAKTQIKEMVDHEITEKTKVRIMPDVHAGKGSTIGTTIKMPENFADWKVSPNVVGVDIGCGIMMYKLSDKEIDLEKLDEVVNRVIPAGFNIHDNPQSLEFTQEVLENLTFDIKSPDRISRIHNSVGTLGGGNHFIELGVDEGGAYWLSVHSGSRNLGVQVAQTHQDIAISNLEENLVNIKPTIENLKKEGRHKEIESTIKEMKAKEVVIDNTDKVLAHLEGRLLKDYLVDMKLAQRYAKESRSTMLDLIVEHMGLTVVDQFDSVHNFIEHDNYKSGMIRKGATSAKKGERLVIPLNMRDGSLICVGKGNDEWNNSAPHGAGRMMSRTQAKNEIKYSDFKNQMKDIYSSSVVEDTLDEAPGAYKPSDVIMSSIEPTAAIVHLVKPVYNFKSH